MLQVGEYLIEDLCRVPVEVEYASEFRYRNPILRPGKDIVMAISQSGETADTLAAIAQAKQAGCKTFGFVNTVGSTIARDVRKKNFGSRAPPLLHSCPLLA